MTLRELGKKIVESSYLKGKFVLSSGKESNYFFDKYAFETKPEILGPVAEEMARRMPGNVTKIACAELGGVALGTALSLKTGLPFVIVRKAKKGYGTDKLIEGKLNPGEQVFLVEDVVTTGTQIIHAARALKDACAKVVKIVCVVDREEGAKAAIEAEGLSFEAVFTRTNLGLK